MKVRIWRKCGKYATEGMAVLRVGGGHASSPQTTAFMYVSKVCGSVYECY